MPPHLASLRMKRFVPLVGTYIVIAVDPLATLRLYCDVVDEIAEQEVRELFAPKTYVGYVAEIEEALPVPEREYHRINWRPLQKGLTSPHSSERVQLEPHMCVPVSPDATHPQGRRPVRTTKPWLWPNCYHPTLSNFPMRVDNKFIDYADATCVVRWDAIQVQDRVFEDHMRYLELEKATDAGCPPPPLPPLRVLPEEDDSDSDDEDGDSQSDDESDESGTIPDRAQEEHNDKDVQKRSGSTAVAVPENELPDHSGKANQDEAARTVPTTMSRSQADDKIDVAVASDAVSAVADRDKLEDDKTQAEITDIILDELRVASYPPEKDDTFTPVVRIVTVNLADLQDFPDYFDLVTEYSVLERIVQDQKARLQAASEKFAAENPIYSNVPEEHSVSAAKTHTGKGGVVGSASNALAWSQNLASKIRVRLRRVLRSLSCTS